MSRRKKLLVANRSEIACRIFQACREMGITSVGIYEKDDEEARHVTYADEVYPIDKYLDISQVLEIATRNKVDLIHPGYGFLSERSPFAEAVEKAGIEFVGPRAPTMRALGEKIEAKKIADRSSVPTLPWAKVNSPQELKKEADRIGYPLLLKASTGGGGKGMRRVDQKSELESAAESAANEARAAFGDDALFVEKLVLEPRHIEVQVFGDGKGGGVHLLERECSLQRRHQKIWEECQAPHLSEKTREGLYKAALSLVKETEYRNAGTVEFLVDQDEKFYFLEMNTRLQVEHPVTEAVTGVDLVQSQLALALGEGCLKQEEVGRRGHALEVRLYAEDPSQGFIPSAGKIEKLIWPTGNGIRVDSGIEEGQTIGTNYDPMLAKLIVSASDRAHAIERLRYALYETAILGVGTNQDFLMSLAKDPRVVEGEVHTAYVDEWLKKNPPAPLTQDECDILSLYVSSSGVRRTELVRGESYPSPWNSFRGL